jgi:hypothetical protein
VFISHSSKNKQAAEAVAAELESNGLQCWMAPRDIRPGEPNYGKAIIDGLTQCRAMVLLLTEQANRSQHVMKEAERAVNKNIPILVVRFQPIEVSKDLEYYVSSAQFLDATAPPPHQHLRPIQDRVREMLSHANRGLPATGVTITVAARPTRRRRRWGLTLAGIGLVAVAGIAAWAVAVPRLKAIWAKVTTAVARAPDLAALSAAPTHSASPAAATASTATSSQRTDAEVEIVPQPPASAAPNSTPLAKAVEGKARFNSTLEAFAKSRLANFHREALVVTKNGDLKPGKVNASDAEILASCKIQPNMNGYTSLAKELIALLEKSALAKGTITSDGLKTSEQYGRDARPHLQEIANEALDRSDGLLDIFASDTHERLVSQHAGTGSCPYVSFPTPFLIYDGSLTIRADNEVERPSTEMAGVSALRWGIWQQLLGQDDTGIVLVLDTAKNSFRHTTWRWFHLPATEWATIANNAPWQFKCVLTLTDASGATVESDFYPLKQYGVGRVAGDRVMSLAPFFVNSDFEHYIPEITLTKPVVVLRDDVPRVKDYTVAIEELPGRPN